MNRRQAILSYAGLTLVVGFGLVYHLWRSNFSGDFVVMLGWIFVPGFVLALFSRSWLIAFLPAVVATVFFSLFWLAFFGSRALLPVADGALHVATTLLVPTNALAVFIARLLTEIGGRHA